MNLFELTRALVDIESITDNEERVGEFLFEHLQTLASRHGGSVEKMPVAEQRFNVLACWGEPIVTFSTHIDTVPPFFASREDDDYIWGRGACDTKGIISAMIHAVEGLLACGLAQSRPAVRCRRGAQQRRRIYRGEVAARVEVS